MTNDERDSLLVRLARRLKLMREPFRYQFEEADGVLICRWAGVHTSRLDSLAGKCASSMADKLGSEPRPVLLDLSAFDYTFSDALDEFLIVLATCMNKSPRAALLLSSENHKIRQRLEVMTPDTPIVDLFEVEAEALDFLRSDEPTAWDTVSSN